MTIDEKAQEILDNYINGNLSDVRDSLNNLSPLNAAAVVACMARRGRRDGSPLFLYWLESFYSVEE